MGVDDVPKDSTTYIMAKSKNNYITACMHRRSGAVQWASSAHGFLCQGEAVPHGPPNDHPGRVLAHQLQADGAHPREF